LDPAHRHSGILPAAPSLPHGSAFRHCRSPKWSLKLVKKISIKIFS
jgi:hypothetical protein